MELKEVVSSNIKKVGYDEEKKDLVVEFSSGTQYAYHNVPKEIYDNLFLAESVGKYVSANVKGKFLFEKLVEQPKQN